MAPDADEQQRNALRLRLGAPLRTPAEVGEVIGVAPESVRRLERSALQKLSHLVAWLDYVLAHQELPRRELIQRDLRAAAP